MIVIELFIVVNKRHYEYWFDFAYQVLLLAVMYEPVVNNVENPSVAFVIILLTKQTPVSLK
ncbi:hypothetical protein BANRA_02417 [Escherichia coli]|nr:hypothetical protein BANRA_02417 [Escherichia coli]